MAPPHTYDGSCFQFDPVALFFQRCLDLLLDQHDFRGFNRHGHGSSNRQLHFVQGLAGNGRAQMQRTRPSL